MISIHCPMCQSLLAFGDALAGSAVSCPDCAAKFEVPAGNLGTAGAKVVVRLTGDTKWMLIEMKLPIVVDGCQVGEGSVKNGFDVIVKMPVGKHDVAIGPAAHTLEFAEGGHYQVDFRYSSMWGKYSLPPRLQRITAEEAKHWPTAKDGPIEVDTEREGISPQDESVLAELERLQQQRPSWWGAIGLLVITAIVYAGAAQLQQIWDSILILIPVLLFHELGHYVAMRGFGYRNLRMFFIPFFGAAVSGQHYNIAGWKKVVVALAGPLPGILLGVPISVIGLVMHEAKVVEVGMLMLILNGFNLLPFLPLDGGWVVHAVLFVRSPVLDVMFRVIAGLAMLGLAILLMSWMLGVVGVVMLIGAPLFYRLGRIVQKLGREGLEARSLDDHSIPQEAALRILADLRPALPANTPPKVLAQHVANVFEMFNAEPPGLFASLALLAVHAAAFITAVVMATVITLLQHHGG